MLTHLIPHEKSHLSQIHQLQFHRAYLDRLFVLLEDQLLLLHTEVKAVLYNFPFTPGTAITKVRFNINSYSQPLGISMFSSRCLLQYPIQWSDHSESRQCP